MYMIPQLISLRILATENILLCFVAAPTQQKLLRSHVATDLRLYKVYYPTVKFLKNIGNRE